MLKNRAILLLAIGQTFIWAGIYYIFPALLLRWEQALGWSKADLTAAIALAVLISASASPFTGRIIDIGRGPVLMAGSAILGGIGLLLLSLVTELWQFYSVWALIGLAMSGCLYEPCFALVTRARGKDAKPSIIFITLVAGFAGTISFPVMYTLAEAIGWRQSTLLFGLIIIFLVSPILWLGAHSLEKSVSNNPTSHSPIATNRSDFLKTPVFWCLAIGFAFAAVVHGATLHHLLPILDGRGLSPEIAVMAASFLGPMQVMGRLAMMASEKYTSHHSVTVTAFLVMGLSIILLLFSGSSPAFLSAFVILYGGAYGTISILRPLITREVLGEQSFGAKSGALAFPYLVGSASAPYLGSIIWGLGGYNLMLSTLAVIAVLGCIFYLVARHLSNRSL